MDNIAREINEGIKSNVLYKQYLQCKYNVENNEYLNSLKKEMDLLKKKNCKGKDEDLIDEYYKIESEYMNNVLVKEYEKAKKELGGLLVEISDILSFK